MMSWSYRYNSIDYLKARYGDRTAGVLHSVPPESMFW